MLTIGQVYDFLDVGDGYYRQTAPGRLLAKLPGVEAVIGLPPYHRSFYTVAHAVDILILHPCHYDWDIFPLIEARRKRGQVTVYELADCIWDIQPWNQVYPHWSNYAIQ